MQHSNCVTCSVHCLTKFEKYMYEQWLIQTKHQVTLCFYFFQIPESTSNFSFGSYKPQIDPSQRKNMFYGVFSTPENSIQGSAICAFTLEDIQKAFTGKFKGQATAHHNWLSIPCDKTPTPHPATSCVEDSKKLPNSALEFIKSHPLMDTAVPAAGGAPILMQTNEKWVFQSLTIFK